MVGAPVAVIWPPVWVLEVGDLIAVLCSKDFVLYVLYLHVFAVLMTGVCKSSAGPL